MKLDRAFWAGVVAGVAMVSLLWVGRLLGLHADFAEIWGTMLLPPGVASWLLGLVIHLLISGLVALAYAWAFETITHRAGAGAGMLLAIPHAIIAGILLGLVPAVTPLGVAGHPAPGAFMAHGSVLGVVVFFLAHLLYGALVGVLYAPFLHPSAEATAA